MSPDITSIIDLYRSQNDVISKLQEMGDISLATAVAGSLSKILIISSASYFEDHIKRCVAQLTKKHSNAMICEFCRVTAIDRGYATWFDWKSQNANKFFSLFGEEAKNSANTTVANNIKLSDSIKNFIYIGSQRNLVVHNNFLTFTITDTPDEIFKKIESAQDFLNFIPRLFDIESH